MTLLDLRLNIQKREAAEEKLETNNKELNAKVKEKTSEITDIFERVSDAFIAVDRDECITYINKKAKAIFSKSSKIILSKSLWNIFPKEVSLKLSQLTHEAMASQKSQSKQFYYEPDRLWFVIHIHPSPNGLSIYLRDITVRKIAEQKRKADKYFSDSIINGLPGIFYLFDTNLNFLRWNENFQTFSGYSAEEIKQMSPLDFFDDDDKPRIIKAIEIVLEKGTTDIEANFLIKSGQKIPHYFTGKFETFEGIPCVMGLGVDITERKEAEKNYRNIFENSLEGIYQSTPSGKFITANPAMANILGYSNPEELIISMTDIESQLYEYPKDRLKLQHLLKRNNQVNAFELQVRKKNGEVIWAHLNIRMVKDEEGNILHFEGILEDITKRKVAEEKLKQQFEELQKTNFELDKFVYSVSHDLRAPLASILGLINVAQLEKLSASQDQYWNMVRSSIIKLEGFIKDILDYSNNARREIKAQKIDFHKIMEEVQENFSYLSGVERLSVTIEVNEKLPFYSDETRIKIILNNLYSNTIKYQDVYKEQSYFKLKVDITAQQAHINVIDNGIGIEEYHLDKVFNMFYRASDNSKGSGLGLYITNETVLKLDGKIEIQSEMGKGTSFDILLPSLS
jgi:PAS domain S-box-containing protein